MARTKKAPLPETVVTLPSSIELYGKRLYAIGRGKYPYDCRAKDEWPDGMIYYSPDAGWDHEHSPCFLRRDQSKDRYGEGDTQ